MRPKPAPRQAKFARSLRRLLAVGGAAGRLLGLGGRRRLGLGDGGRTLGACGSDIGIVEEKRCKRLPEMPLNMEDGLESYLGRLCR